MNVPKKKRLKYKELVKFYYELRTNYRSLKKKIDQMSTILNKSSCTLLMRHQTTRYQTDFPAL